MQSPTSIYSGTIPGNRVDTVAEDCLTLDVWTPDGADHLPVMVWVPGGAYLTGGTGIETYDGANLAADGEVVVVSINYRLGVFGFAWFGPGVGDTNCGLRDIAAALTWVRHNVGAFGGNEDNVTMFGESAGAGAIAHLLSSPMVAQPPRRVILQSPGIDHTLFPDDAEVVADVLLRHLSIPWADAPRLSALPAEALLAAQEAVMPALMPVLSSMPFHPFVDGDVVSSRPSLDGSSGRDLLVSYTTDEMRLYPDTTAARAGGWDGLHQRTRRYLTRRTGMDPGLDPARDLVTFYRDRLASAGRNSCADVWAAIQTDGIMRLPIRRLADAHAAGSPRTYAAEFAWSSPPPAGEWDRGAFHAIDLPFTFGTLDRGGWREFLGAGAAANTLARQHMAAWAAFARDGKPRVPDLADWPAYGGPDRATLVLDAPCSIERDPLGEIAQAWDGLWSDACRAPLAIY
jgi:para-nitrobenzyl esterase